MLYNKCIKLYSLLAFMRCYSSQDTEIATSYKDTETKDRTNKQIIIGVVSTSIIATTAGIMFDNSKKNNSLVKTAPSKPDEIKKEKLEKFQKNTHKESLDHQTITQSNEYASLIELRDKLNSSANTTFDEPSYLQYIIKFLDLISKNPKLTANTFANLLETFTLRQDFIGTISGSNSGKYKGIYSRLFGPFCKKEEILINRLDQALFLSYNDIKAFYDDIEILDEQLNKSFHDTKEKEIIKSSLNIIRNLLTAEDIENIFKDLREDLLALRQENEYLYFDAYLYCAWKLTYKTSSDQEIQFVGEQNNQIDSFKKKRLDQLFTAENKFNIKLTAFELAACLDPDIYYPDIVKYRIIMHNGVHRFFCWHYSVWNSLTANLLEKCYLNKFGFLTIENKKSINKKLSELCFLFKKNREYYNQLKGEEKKQFLFKWFGVLKHYSITDKDTYNYSQEFNEFYNNIDSNNDLMDNVKEDLQKINVQLKREFENQNSIKYDFFGSDDDRENVANILKFIDEISREFVNFFDTFFYEAKKILSIDDIKSVPNQYNDMKNIYQEIKEIFNIENVDINSIISDMNIKEKEGMYFIKQFNESNFAILLHHINGNHYEGFYKTYDEKRFKWIVSMLKMIEKENVPLYSSQSSSYIPYIFRGITTSTSTLK